MRLIVTTLALLALALPAGAQEIDFGDDASRWANDGECDDMRFAGPGMTMSPLLEADIGHDATDCRTAWEEGRLRLAAEGEPGGFRTDVNVPPATGGLAAGGLGKIDKQRPAAPAQEDIVIDGIRFGNDDGPWARDGECDDRRFFGPGMASVLSWAALGGDASDCAAAYSAGEVFVWRQDEALAATQCTAIDFGDDDGEYPFDGECDDMRFEGRGVAMQLSSDATGHDASDCRRLCDFGVIGLRDY